MTGQILELRFKKYLNEALLRKIGEAVAKESLKIIKERTAEGIDIYGRKFGSYTAKYDLLKRKRFASNYKKPLQATGELMNSLTSKLIDVKRGSISKIRINITAKADQLDKVEGLQSETGVARNRKRYSKIQRAFLGLSEAGSRYTLERSIIQRIIKKHLQEAVINAKSY